MRHIKRPGWVSLLVIGLVLLRGLVPAGFMLAPLDGALTFVLCDADAPVPAMSSMPGMADMPDMPDMPGMAQMAAGTMPASHHAMPMAMGHAAHHAAHGHAAHGDPTCPYAQSSGPAPLPTLPVLAGSMPALERPRLPAASQTLLGFGPIRQPSSRGPPRLA